MVPNGRIPIQHDAVCRAVIYHNYCRAKLPAPMQLAIMLLVNDAEGTHRFKSIPGVTLNMPSGMWRKDKQLQYTVEEVQPSENVSKARVHVERAISYVKKFNIMNKRICLELVPHLGKIVYVCAKST